MTKSELRLRVSNELKKEIKHLAIEQEMFANVLCEKLLWYALDHTDEIFQD